MPGNFEAFVKDGQVPAGAVGTLWTSPALTWCYVRTMRFYNTNAVQQTVLVYLDPSGTERKGWRFQLDLDEFAVIDDRITMEAGDIIKAITTTAAAVEFSVHGVKET